MSVSIITITQLSRNKCLQNLKILIENQDYPNIIEWIIVEGSKSEVDAIENHFNILQLQKNFKKIPIKYIEYDNSSFAELHNKANSNCNGDIIVIMEDDDYYPPTRISHAVEKLINSNYLIAGCSGIYMFVFKTNKLYKFRQFGKYHSCNHAFAYKKEYLHNHKFNYDLLTDNSAYKIEPSFTNNFTEPMIQLDPLKTIIHSIHSNNTFTEKLLVLDEWKKQDRVHEVLFDSLNDVDRFGIELMKSLFL